MTQRPRLEFVVALLVTSVFWTASARAEIPSRMEPEYAEAVLTYNSHKFDEAVDRLDDLIKRSPDTVEFLQLKALALKNAQRGAEAAELYQKLIDLKQGKADPEEVAPYQFELGVMRFREGKTDEAARLLQASIDAGFNEGPAHFFLGLQEYKGAHMAQALSHFHAVTSSSSDELKPPAYFYQAQIDAKTGHPSAATYDLLKARNWGADLEKDPEVSQETRDIAQRIRTEAAKAIEPLDHGRWFGNLAAMTAYDSNVLAEPDTSANTSGSGHSTLKLLGNYNVGYMTSPLSLIQLVPNLRGSLPFHFNGDSQAGEFVTNDLSLYATYKPLAPFHFGIKLEGDIDFNNSDSAAGRFKYNQFSRMVGVGPFFKYEFSDKKIIGFEEWNQDTHYLAESTNPEERRSGEDHRGRFYFRDDAGKMFWNPTVSVTIGGVGTHSDFSHQYYNPAIDNQMYINDDWTLGQSLSFTRAHYSHFSGGTRSDSTSSLDLSATRRINPKVSAIGEIRFTDQGSSDPSFTYNQVVISAGASYSL